MSISDNDMEHLSKVEYLMFKGIICRSIRDDSHQFLTPIRANVIEVFHVRCYFDYSMRHSHQKPFDKPGERASAYNVLPRSELHTACTTNAILCCWNPSHMKSCTPSGTPRVWKRGRILRNRRHRELLNSRGHKIYIL